MTGHRPLCATTVDLGAMHLSVLPHWLVSVPSVQGHDEHLVPGVTAAATDHRLLVPACLARTLICRQQCNPQAHTQQWVSRVE